jgi:phosphohistidine phosphatase SixA
VSLPRLKTSGPGAIVEWLVKPFLTALWVVVLGGLLVGTFSQQYSFVALREILHRKFAQDYERKLSASLLSELRAGGFTFFIRHASRDGVDVPATSALDWAFTVDPAAVPAEFHWGLCLNEFGRVESRLLGQFFRRATIPVGEVLASPLCRARETAELSVGRVDRLEPSLVTIGGPNERAARTIGLKQLLEQTPRRGANRLLFSHTSVLEAQGFDRLDAEQAGMVILQHTSQGLKVRAVVTLREMWSALLAAANP